MPLIEPTNLEECVRFVRQQRDDIRNGVYDVKIKESWVCKLDLSDLQLLTRYCESAKYIIASNTTVEKLLENLANEYEDNIRAGVAGNINTPSKILVKLSKDHADYVRSMVARNSNTPESVLRILSMDSSERVRKGVADNDGAPIDLIKQLPKERWCDICGRLCDTKEMWFGGNYECHICNRYYCKKHGQEVQMNVGPDDSDTAYYWFRCIDHLKVPNKLGYYYWNTFFGTFFTGKADQERNNY